jgi:hypothetical protein
MADLTSTLFFSAKRWLFMIAASVVPEFKQMSDDLYAAVEKMQEEALKRRDKA